LTIFCDRDIIWVSPSVQAATQRSPQAHSPACGVLHLRQVVEVAKQRGKRMDPRHRRFVLEYIQDLDATAAARRAGYSPRSAKNTGYRLMQRPEIQQAIAEAQADLERELIDSAERVRRDLLRATEGAIEDRDWRGLGKLAELRCKCLGMLVDRHRVEGADGSAPTIVLRWSES
jgi:hypothetical protein